MQTTFVPFQQTSRSRSRSRSPAPDWRLQKPFGAGLSRRPVKFVPASDTDTDTTTTTTGTDVSSLYLSLVGLAPATTTSTTPTPEICPDCSLPITATTAAAHATSTAHLSALPHAHPPHPYDRSSKGLKVLVSSGWDPDARVGLGPDGAGMRYPLKTVRKDDRLGVGLKARGGEAPAKVVKREGVKEARRREAAGKKRRGRLMGELGGGVDVEEVLNREME